MMTLKNPYDSWLTLGYLLVNSELKMAVLEINRNDIIWSMGPSCTHQERMKPILFCYWDLCQYKKWMPPLPNWDGLPTCL